MKKNGSGEKLQKSNINTDDWALQVDTCGAFFHLFRIMCLYDILKK